MEGALLKLAQIAAANLGLIGQFVLRQAPRVPQAAQIGGEYPSQVHARREARTSIYSTPIY